ncbi:MAG: acyl-CoA dehydrogenase family protein [Gemmatales bacterium]|nr:acyl-CoA dehydrogenase family protein [Gemmatales bacterium]MDW8386809.1 acyl-CoA dehydrogenase family protein [Gemmatales bacterium]
MGAGQFDVLVIGGGCAGLSASIGLAKAGFHVAVVEAAPFPGAENWSGCVYFTENLAHPSLLGPEAVEELAWERRLVERGFFLSDGYSLFGIRYRDSEAFRHCYTVLRPIFDQHLAHLAVQQGVVVLNNTTAESLIRDGERVIGAATHRGPIYADLTFLAEGDASHLVTREGLERPVPTDGKPSFLHGIKQVIELPPEAVEANFGLGPDEGAAYEIVLRNGTLKGRRLHLNMGGFLYTNRQSLSIGLVLPAEHLARNFDGDPHLLLEWFESLPPVQRWCRGGRRSVYGAKLIRGGGAKDIPHLVSDGLAVGGAATAIGTDFPYPNYTGPATRMGLLLVEAAKAIRAEGGSFTEAELQRHYVQPLQQTRAWKDVEFLRRWPSYVERTQWFFDGNVETTLKTAYVWTRPRRWNRSRVLDFARLLVEQFGPERWLKLREDWTALRKALRFKHITGRPAVGRLLLHGWLNAFRDLVGLPRVGVPAAGEIRFEYWVGAENRGPEPLRAPLAQATPEPLRAPLAGENVPWFVRRWVRRFLPVLAASARRVYTNDDEPLESKLRNALALLFRQVNLLDFLIAAFAGVGIALLALILAGLRFVKSRLGLATNFAGVGHLGDYEKARSGVGDLTRLRETAAANWEQRLGELHYDAPARSHIHVHWPTRLDKRFEIVQDGLWHVCPAHVYEARPGPQNQLQIIVNHENCIKCETCWRTTDAVDWGRDGRHRFIYPVASPASLRVQQAADRAASTSPSLPSQSGPWPEQANPAVPSKIGSLIEVLDRQFQALAEALYEEPRTVDAARADYLIRLGHYAEQVAQELAVLLPPPPSSFTEHPEQKSQRGTDTLPFGIIRDIAARTGRVTHWLRNRKYAWAVAEARQIRQHHLDGLRRLLGHSRRLTPSARRELEDQREVIRHSLDEILPDAIWRSLEPEGTRHEGITPRLAPHQEQALLDLAASVPRWQPGEKVSPHPRRKALLAELAARDPSLAYRVSSHLLARDLAGVPADSVWLALGVVSEEENRRESSSVTAWFVPEAERTFLLVGDHLIEASPDAPRIQHQPLAPLGLRGAGLQKIVLDAAKPLPAPQPGLRHAWQLLASADLIAMAHGMADTLVRRATEHASTRVQFPGLYSDDEARDTIAKFGAVKKLLAQMACRRQLLDLFDGLSPENSSDGSPESRLMLLKALSADLLGTAPGSLSYNAGQIFGGTGYSEDDILAKFYRDAAAFRYLGPSNPSLWLRHGRQLIENGHLSEWPDEVHLFDRIAQRKALLVELEQMRLCRNRLRAAVNCLRHQASASRDDQLLMALARLDVGLLAAKGLLLDLHRRLERAEPVEVETALLQCWVDEVIGQLCQLEERLRTAQAVPLISDTRDRQVEKPTTREYELLLATPLPYDTGDYLVKPADFTAPRLTPELAACDVGLKELDDRYRQLFHEQFGRPRDGKPFERWLEDRHCPANEDLDFLRQHGCFRFLIPKDLGGEGLRKADYYLMVQNAQREADVATALTIQVNASLGTTPIFLARFKDIPKAKKELAAFVADHAFHQHIEAELQKIQACNNIAEVRRGFEGLRETVEKRILGVTAVRVVCHRFVTAWTNLGRAMREYDVTGCRAELRHAAEGWHHACAVAPDLLAELDRRAEACDFFLRLIASGQISAFALTEPSAGSDTARLASRAVLHSVPIERAPDGVLEFVPHGVRERRVLLDARRIEVRSDGLYYRWSDEAPASRIQTEEYDYETDNPQCRRYYLHGSRKVYFSDIGQIRERGGKLWYDYWEINGSKMWITNGRIMGVLALYARTEEGVTGFLVDRHAEGLIVGKDERKLGQCGSPTNELSLISLRVSRENVLGLEGRGQVNALETLNLGRAGIAMSTLASLQTVVGACRDHLAQAVRESSTEHLRPLEVNQYLAESLAFDLVGRLEHPQTRSLRIEASIAKFMVTELYHETIELAEDLHGLPGQTQEFIIEKRKRDARVLNIYEGTNEIQRSLIWTHLVNEVLPRWKEDAGIAAGQPEAFQPHIAEYLRWRAEFRQRLREVVGLFGANVVHNPSFQASCFELAEAAAWLKAMECVLGRWIWQHRFGLGDTSAACDAFHRCRSETAARLTHFDTEMERHRKGQYAPSIRAASLVLNRYRESEPVGQPQITARIARPLDVLVLVEFEPVTSSQPLFHEERLLEATWQPTAASRSALESALRLRDAAPSLVRLHAAAVGEARLAAQLREVLAHGVESATLIATSDGSVSTLATVDEAASALVRHFQEQAGSKGREFDLVLAPQGDGRSEEGLLGQHLAGIWDRDCVSWNGNLEVQHDAVASELRMVEAKRIRRHALPTVLTVPAGVALRDFTTQGYLAGLSARLDLVPWPKNVPVTEAAWLVEADSDQRAGTDTLSKPILLADEAANLLREELGLGGEAATLEPFPAEQIVSVSDPSLLRNSPSVAVLAADSQGRLAEGARAVLQADPRATALILVSPDIAAQQSAAGQAARFGARRIVLVEVPKEAVVIAAWKQRIAEEVWHALQLQPQLVVGENWLEPVWPRLWGQERRQGSMLLRVSRLKRVPDGCLAVCRRGKLAVGYRLAIARGQTFWLTLLPEAEVEGQAIETGTVQVQRWTPSSTTLFTKETLTSMLAQVREEVGTPQLKDAEFIIDVGFGIGNRDGYEAIVPPLEKALRSLGVANFAIGGSRKVTEELRLLPVDRQIGQSGVSVRPRILLAIGISGAPQHLSYIDPRATIIAFNRDPEAPIMTLNRRQTRPRVFGVVGDLFETVPAFIAALQDQR